MIKETGRSFNRRDFLKMVPAAVAGAAGGIIIAEKNPLQQIDIWEHPLPAPEPDTTRFLLIADAHVGDFDNGPRQNNSKSLDTLRSVLSHLNGYPFTRLIQMGDLIREQNNEQINISNFRKAIQVLTSVPFPVSHILGNHDVWGISPQNLVNIGSENNLIFYGVEEYNNFQIVWLDMEAAPGTPGTLAEDRIGWLRNNVIYKDTPTIIFSHYAVLPQDPSGNYYFEGNAGQTAYTNGKKVWESLKDMPISAIVSAHMHWIGYSRVDKTHMITVPSFVENMLSSDSEENPGVYSIMEIDYPNKLALKSYFGSICVSQIQISF